MNDEHTRKNVTKIHPEKMAEMIFLAKLLLFLG